MRLELPYPDKRLNPNARLHPKAKGALVKKARADAHVIVLEAAGASLSAIRAGLAGDAPIPLQIVFYAPDRQHRDLDNAIAALKGAMDGVADALHVNDRRFQPTYAFGIPQGKPGRVEIEVGA